ncbi:MULTISPECIES: RNA polymerase factor sigma-54 [unclassified Paracoccus (in: a-proteobacteria)]|uniref:RNA polymerase factor sigma-54 n=1 Tax=unclassified Paracoccus (in: a-proteobacteria) TaxID=2688777 RepID=UPI0012B273C0|nr:MULTISPECIES: helix-turn-helix domain-containing protein [unclassified Paracoccus (in: a-proteobacteria)]UXU75024.1 RNA polymerase subunit sigma-54 [Paracoccus sp. SMMA_5]UXU80927.1 RNA polymerase subunit sigma-54 [Paracoccus sp. SMMA_5_TC]
MQRQDQRQIRGLKLSQHMRLSLDLLAMDAGRIRRRLRLEASRNPFLVLSEPAESISARQALLGQIGLLRLAREQAELARALVHCLDDHGLLAEPLAEIAGWLEVPVPRIEALLPVLQELEPPGVFARDLPEALALQLRARGRLDPMIGRLLTRLDLVAARDIAAIQAFCGCDAEDASDMIADLHSLSPVSLGDDTPELIAPELLLTADGGLRLLDAPSAMFEGTAGAAATDRQAALARALVAGCNARQATLLRVARLMVATQAGFLLHGRAPRPLTLGDLASRSGLARSTISRCIAGVAMQAPRGTLFLRELLLAPASPDNPELGPRQLRQALQDVIATWPDGLRLSDAALTEELARRGIHLARRTVAKYRADLGVPGWNRGRNIQG